MKNFLFLVIVSIVAIGIFTTVKFLLPNASTATGITSPTRTSACAGFQLDTMMNPDLAAGNAYVKVTIKNRSDKPCLIIGNNQLEIQYPNSVTNFKTELRKPPTKNLFTLAPNQTIYSLIQYANGPQCSTNASFVNTAVRYKISDTETISFKPTQGDTLDIPSCGNKTDITQIDLYSFSDTEVLP